MATNLQELIPAIFTGPNGERLTPEQIAQRQQVAQSLIGRATDTSPDAGGWASVLTKGLLGFQSGRDRRAADNAITANAAAEQSLISDMLGSLGGGAGFPTAVAAGASPTSVAAVGEPVAIPSAPEIRQGLIDRGLQPHIADAFILNFQDESGLNPGINEKNPIVPGSRGGFGLYQLTGPRRREYEAFAAQRGVDPADTNAQLDFLMNELQGSEAGAAKSILSAPDTATAAQAIVNNFLRPAPEYRQARAAKYGRVATTPQEAIEQVAPIEGLPAAQVAPYDFASDPNLSVASALVNPMGAAGSAPGKVDRLSPAGNFNDRWNAGAATAPIVPEQAIPASANIVPEVTPMAVTGDTSSSDQRLLALNDQMLGGALSPSGSSPVAQALSGSFPSAPSADRAPVTSQPFQMPAQSQSGGINPAIIQALSSPYVSNQGRQVASLLLGRQLDASDPMKQAELQLRQAQTQQALRKANNPLGDETFFGNPIAIQGPDGQIQYGQIGNKGSFRPIQLGEGQTFAPPTRTVDTGTEVIQMTQNGEVISRTPKQNREAAAQTAGGQVEGKTEAERRIAAPADIQTGQNTISLIDKIKSHPGLKMGTGLGSYANAIPGTPGYDFQNLVDQAKSGAFLSAIQQMRGMGSLSNAEGDAATRAVNRINTATSTDAFLDALSDYQTIVQQGIERAQRSVGSNGGGSGGNKTSTGVTWSVE